MLACMNFRAASEITPVNSNEFAWDVPDEWQQGRGAFGGLVLGALARAMQVSVASPARVLRSLTGVIAAPVAVGPSSLSVEVMRAGSGLSTVASRLTQDGELRAHSVAIFAEARQIDYKGWSPTNSPVIGTPMDAVSIPVAPPMGPVFAQKMEFRSNGAYPYTSSDQEVTGWVRFKDDDSELDVAALIGLMDAYWPCALVRASQPRPMSTVSFSLEIANLPANLRLNEFVYYRGRSEFCVDGFSTEFRELWSAKGELLALNQQIFVIIK